jgi:hypothetical protein
VHSKGFTHVAFCSVSATIIGPLYIQGDAVKNATQKTGEKDERRDGAV